MISRSDFIFIIGYDGATALVDKKAQRLYSKLTTIELAEAGLLKAAFCSALYSGDSQEQQKLMSWYKANSEVPSENFENLRQYFGVFEIPEAIKIVKK